MPKYIPRVINPRKRKKVSPTTTRFVPVIEEDVLPEPKKEPVKRGHRNTKKSKDEERLNETNPVYSGQY